MPGNISPHSWKAHRAQLNVMGRADEAFKDARHVGIGRSVLLLSYIQDLSF